MKGKTYAAIDIGSNAARLLIKRDKGDCDDKLEKLMLLRVPLRLGFDVFSKNRISGKKAENLVRLMKAYRQLMKIYGVDEMRACATSAMRDAENGKELIKEIEEETGIKIEIIAGEEEAKIVYNNHVEYTCDRKGNFLYVDVGGGSTEINFLSDGDLKVSMSFNIGTIRLLTGEVSPKECNSLRQQLRMLQPEGKEMVIIGSGGNINKLYKMARDKDEDANSFEVEELQRLYDMLHPLSVEERMEKFKLKADRADVIIPAAEIFLTVANTVGAKRIVVPVIGVADGIIDGLYEADKIKESR